MKCEKCNGKEAVFFYSADINGQRYSRNLCADCARAEGFADASDFDPANMFPATASRLFSEFFPPMGALFPSFGLFGMPERSIITPSVPKLNIVLPGESGKAQEREKTQSAAAFDAGSEVKQRRALAALKYQLEEAVQAENYEKAIELRDKIREIEK